MTLDETGVARFTEREQAILDSFSYHKPSDEAAQRIENVRYVCRTAAVGIMANVPDSADRTVALRKLHEAMMNANKAIVLEPPPQAA